MQKLRGVQLVEQRITVWERKEHRVPGILWEISRTPCGKHGKRQSRL